MKTICGVDEAGRGPVLGPLVMAGILIEEKEVKKLTNLDVKDSKLLTEIQRNQLFPKIKEAVKKHKIITVEPKEIDDAVNDKELNLNWLEAHKSAEIINTLNPDKAIVDCPSANVEAYKDYLQNLIKNKNTELIVEHKADENYPEVSAASILAKVTRDKEIEQIKKKYGDVGPGYPSNEITQKFLKENWDKCPEIFRRSWTSYKRIEKEQMQSSLNDFD